MSKLKIIDSFFKIKKDSTVTNLTMVHSIDILNINFNTQYRYIKYKF